MPDSTNPQVPNFQSGVGRLVTDRFDFQAHIDGQNFRHVANQIDLSPLITINGGTYNNAQDAIAVLAALINPVIPQATVGTLATNLGIITLGGDLGGTALIPRVTGLQGYQVSTLPPSTGNLLTWNGSFWAPAAPTTNFTTTVNFGATVNFNNIVNFANTSTVTGTLTSLSGSNIDVAGNITIENSGALTIGGALLLNGNATVAWAAGADDPGLNQNSVSTGFGTDMVLMAQTTAAAGKTGGRLILNSGGSGSGITQPTGTILQSSRNGGTLVAYPPQGTANTQNGINGIYQCFCTTSATQTVPFLSLFMFASSSAVIEVSWTRRNTSGSFSSIGNKAGLTAQCTAGNTVTFNTLTAAYSGSGFDLVASISISTAANTLNFSASGTGSDTQDWQIVVTVNLC